jgi:hypothetical protein
MAREDLRRTPDPQTSRPAAAGSSRNVLRKPFANNFSRGLHEFNSRVLDHLADCGLALESPVGAVDTRCYCLRIGELESVVRHVQLLKFL